MPTSNPRINVTVSPSLDALVQRLAAAQRVSKSQVLRELLEAAEPALQRAATMMEAAKKASQQMKGEVLRSLDRAQGQAEAELARAMARMDSVSQDLVSMAEAVKARRPARASKAAPPASKPAPGPQAPARHPRGRSAASDPPPSNRGVKSSRRGAK
jgi:uncharacterized protein (DUF1778 family)